MPEDDFFDEDMASRVIRDVRNISKFNGETILMSESGDFRNWYFNYTERALQLASIIGLPVMQHVDGRSAVCIPDSMRDMFVKKAAVYGITIQFHTLPDNRIDETTR